MSKSRIGLASLVTSLLVAGPVGAAHGDAYDRRLDDARAALDARHLDDAELAFRRLTDLYPHQVAPYAGLADVFAAQGATGDAVDLLADVGAQLELLTRYDEAKEILLRATELDPGRADVQALLGRALLRLDRALDAAACFEHAVAAGDATLRTRFELADAYRAGHRFADAEAVLRRAAEERGEHPLVHRRLGELLLFVGRPAEAVASLERALALDPDDEATVRLLERARTAVASGVRPASEEASRVRLTDVARAAGVVFLHDPGRTPEYRLHETMGAGLAWLDADGDGWLDLYVVQSTPNAPARLFRNRGGVFEDVTERASAGVRFIGQGATAADVDGDGDTDLVLTGYGCAILLDNRGDGTFAEHDLELDGWTSSAALADADGDSDLDLYVSRYVETGPDEGGGCRGADGEPDYCDIAPFAGDGDVLLLQDGGGAFHDQTVEAGLEHVYGRGLGVSWQDLDGDRRPDLYVANDLDPNRLFKNLGGGRFEDVSLFSGAAVDPEGKPQAGMGVASGDVDGDGRPDVLVTNFELERNALYRNEGDLSFTDVTAPSGFGLPSMGLLGFGLALADLDADGDLDVYVANGHVLERPGRQGVSHAQADLVLLGDGHGGFQKAELEGLPAGVGRGVAAADWDRDGDPDLGVQQNGGRFVLLENGADAGGRWLGVELCGAGKNTAAVGAAVRLETVTADGTSRVQTRWVTAGGGYQSSADPRPLFAWPPGETPRRLDVLWPGGRTTRMADPPAGYILRISEPPSSSLH